MNKDKRKLVPVRNNPGIYKVFENDQEKWRDTGRFLSTRRVMRGPVSVREKAVFRNLGDAKDFRAGKIDGSSSPNVVHRNSQSDAKYTFAQLVEEWKKFHYLTLEEGTVNLYDRKIPLLAPLNNMEVAAIDTSAVDGLVKYWVQEWLKVRGRQCFDKELTLLTTVLNFYRSRKDRSFVSPVEKSHYEAATLRKRAKGQVKALEANDLNRFLEGLRHPERKSGMPFYEVACTQFGLSLRIGEACGIRPEDIDLRNGLARIEQTVIWNDRSWEASIKEYPKNGFARILVIPDFLTPILDGAIQKHDPAVSPLLFHKASGEPLNRKSIAQSYNRALGRLGIKYVSGTHMVRATAATHANEITGDFFAVSKQLDHSSLEVTKRYVKHVGSQKRKVAEALNSVVAKVGENAA